MKTAKQILKEKNLLIEDGSTCEAHTPLVVEAMQEYAEQSAKMINVNFYPNGSTVAFNEIGEQVPELQQSWFTLYLDHIEKEGYDINKICFEMSDGRIAKPIRITEGGWNWSVEPGW